ncbi:MAG: nucleotidyltransferase family protein [Spirochaetales bacterium]|nr:nucleotidyltransferase family protein [Spirochaetales bacterium]
MIESIHRLPPEEQFLVFLYSPKSASDSTGRVGAGAVDASRFWSLLKQNKLLRRTAYEFTVNKNPPLPALLSGLGPRFEQLLLLWEQEKQVYLRAFSAISSAFLKAGIESCLLKGLSMGNPDIPRDMGDLDILVRQNNLMKAAGILQELGYEYTGDGRKARLKGCERGGNFEALQKWSNQFEFFDEKTGLLVEVHTNFFERRRVYAFDIDPIWNSVEAVFQRRRVSPALGFTVLNEEDRLWLTAMHAAVRATPTRGMFVFRYYLDMAELVGSSDIDWDALILHARLTRTQGFMWYSFIMCNRFFPGTVSSSVLGRLWNDLTAGKKLLHRLQLACFRSMQKESTLHVLLFRLMLPFCYNGSIGERVKSILVIPHIVHNRVGIARIYGVDPGEWFVPLLYGVEPFRLCVSLLRRIAGRSTHAGRR